MTEGRAYTKDFSHWDGTVWVESGGIKNAKKAVVFFWEIYRGVWGGEGKEEFFVTMLLSLL